MAENIALAGATIYTGSEIIKGRTVLVKNGLITRIAEDGPVPPGTELIDCTGSFLSPGFIDLQIAGASGFLFSADPSVKALEAITSGILTSGTTGFLLVLPTNSTEVYLKAIETVRSNPHPAILGLHLEGPYISIEKRGAHVQRLIRKPDLSELRTLLKAGEGIIKMVTVAPEICFPEFISLLNDSGIVVCAGHSNATYREASSGFDWGIRATTHLFNAMSPFHHRDPGLPGATFQAKGVMASIVADGVHVDFNAISIAKKLLKERLYLISDAVEESRIGEYQHVKRDDRFTLPDGTLSGSALTMMKAVQNCVAKAGIDIDEALRMGSLYPARLMGLYDRGSITPGSKADMLVFNESFNVQMVIKDGVKT